jgi:hypothetical protein
LGVNFAPNSVGPKTAGISIASNATGSPHMVALSGQGVQPMVGLSTTSVTFGNQAVGTTSPDMTVTLTNTGTADLNVASITKVGTDPADFTLLLGGSFTCPATGNPTLVPSDNCTLGVNFAPLSSGQKTAAISIASDAPGSPHTVMLSGTATVLPQGVLERVSLASVDAMGNSAEGNDGAGRSRPPITPRRSVPTVASQPLPL